METVLFSVKEEIIHLRRRKKATTCVILSESCNFIFHGIMVMYSLELELQCVITLNYIKI